MQSFVAHFILLLLHITSASSQDVIWKDLVGYTCTDLIPAMNIFYNISLDECHSMCVSSTSTPTTPSPQSPFTMNETASPSESPTSPTEEPTQRPTFDYASPCTATVWYEYVKNTGNDVPRCYLFGQSCELMTDPTKPVTTSFWYNDVTDDLNCVDYPSNWKDNFFDTCDAYSLWNWCDYAYNSSTTAILSYQDTIYGFDALKVCCGCNGGLYNYDNTYLFEAKWKPTSKLNIYEDTDDFICRPLDFTSTLIDNIIIFDEDKFTLTQFIGLCQQIHAALYDQYRLLLSINTESNRIINRNDIDIDFTRFRDFDCVDNILLYDVIICNDTDYNNLYPFIIDLEQSDIYINNHYIDVDTFLYHLPPTHINIETYCTFADLLETVYPTEPPTNAPTMEPTLAPTMEPTEEPTSEPTVPSSEPTISPTFNPTTEPTVEPTTDPSTHPTSEPTVVPTRDPTRDPTNEPTTEPTVVPTNEPTTEPTQNTVNPTESPTNEPTTEPTGDPTTEPTEVPGGRRRVLADADPFFTTNMIAVFLCDTRFTTDPTANPTTDPTLSSIDVEPSVISTIDTIVDDDDEASSDGGSSAVYIVLFSIIGVLLCIGIAGGVVYYLKNRDSEPSKPKPRMQPPAPPVPVDTPQPPPVSTLQMGLPTAPPEDDEAASAPQWDDVYDDDADDNATWRFKKMKDWSNDEILDWVRSMKLGAQGSNQILGEIQGNGCVGEDICGLTCASDVGDAFNIADKALRKKIYAGIKNFKPRGKQKSDRFRINLFSKGRDIMLDQEVAKSDTVQFVKSLFKIQMELDVDVEYIHFRYKNKELNSRKTLQQSGIKNSNHLITVEMDDVFSININSQQKHTVLNKKVTKKCTVRALKNMYKIQSGVRSTIDDIHFYAKGKVLDPNKTLQQVGIVDEKHLISVKFGADGANS